MLYAYCNDRMAAVRCCSVGMMYVASLCAVYDRSGRVLSARNRSIPLMVLYVFLVCSFGMMSVMYGRGVVGSGVVTVWLIGMLRSVSLVCMYCC